MPGQEGDAPSVDRITRPTHADVARLARVSTATVSYVLNKSEGRRISPRTTEAVYRAAEQLGYRPNAAARNLASGKSGVVLYVVPRVAVGEMPMQAGSRMTTELARLGLLQVQIFETEDDQHVIDAVENLEFRIFAALVEFPVVPEDRAPVVYRRRDHAAQRRGGHLEIFELGHGRLDHVFGAGDRRGIDFIRACRTHQIDHLFRGVNRRVGHVSLRIRVRMTGCESPHCGRRR